MKLWLITLGHAVDDDNDVAVPMLVPAVDQAEAERIGLQVAERLRIELLNEPVEINPEIPVSDLDDQGER